MRLSPQQAASIRSARCARPTNMLRAAKCSRSIRASHPLTVMLRAAKRSRSILTREQPLAVGASVQCVERVRQRGPATVDVPQLDGAEQGIITRRLTRAAQVCVDTAAHIYADTPTRAVSRMGESFTRLAEAGVRDAACL